MFDIRLRKTSITKTYTTNLPLLLSSRSQLVTSADFFSRLKQSDLAKASVRKSLFCCRLQKLPCALLLSVVTAVSDRCNPPPRYSPPVFIRTNIHGSFYWAHQQVLLHMTSIEIFRLFLRSCSTSISVFISLWDFWTAHFVTTSLTITMSRWGLHNKFVQISLYKKLFNKSWSLSVLWVSSGCTL